MSTTVLEHGAEADLASILLAYHDVTERLKRSHDDLTREVTRLREELRAKNRELQRRQRLSALGEMAAGVAHEIRNPLGGVGLYAALLDRDLGDRPRLREVVRKMNVGIRNMEGIVSDILTFAGDAEPVRRRISMTRIQDAVMEQVAPRAETHGVQVLVDPQLAECEVFADASQLERALINLVLNAIDVVGTGGKVWLKASAGRKADGALSILVEDNGPGVPPELQHRIFDPFFTTKDTGTGLGLAIVHRIAESHGGSIQAGNRSEGGARFTLTLPGEEPTERADSSKRTVEAIGG